MVEIGGGLAVGTPLRRFSVLRSARGGEVRARLSRLLSPHRPITAGGSGGLVDLSAVDLGPLSLVYCRSYGNEIGIELTEQVSYYDVNFALVGSNRLECGDERLVLTPRTAGIISPPMRAKMHLSAGYSQLHLRIERHALERHLERMLGRHVAGPIRFRAEIDLTTPALASWAQAVHLLVRDLDEPSGLSAFGPQLRLWSDFLMTALLLAQPHDYSARLAWRHATVAPLSVRRVVDLIEQDPASDLTLTRLAAVAGVGARSLQRNFRTYLGVSPREYIQSVRLARAHDELVAGAGTTVAEIAFRWGFTHVPRFAGRYRERYGVPPSTTLRASRP